MLDFLKIRPTQSNLVKLGLELSLAISVPTNQPAAALGPVKNIKLSLNLKLVELQFFRTNTLLGFLWTLFFSP